MMHQFFAIFVAMVVSLCHHNAGLQPVAAAMTAVPAYAGQQAPEGPLLRFPDREALARGGVTASYAESACASCQMTTVSYTTP